MLPNRFQTGVREVTVPNPARLYKSDPDARVFEGLVEDYNFERQTENFRRLQAVLLENGTKFTHVAAAHYAGDLHTNHRFNVVSADGKVLWHKYVGYAAQSGQNHLFLGGMRVKVSYFLAMPKEEQRALLSGERVLINLVFEPSRLKFLDEAGTLWN